MKNKKMLAMVLVLSMMCGLVACGNKEAKKATTEKKAETTVENEVEVAVEAEEETEKQENVEVNQPDEQQVEQQTEQPKEQSVTTQKKNTSGANTQKGNTTTNASASNSQTTASAPVNNQSQPSTTTHEHVWTLEVAERYDVIKTYVNGCNGCGYPLFTITETGTQHIENLYFHPACYSEKLGGDCTGGGFHSESYTRGYCGYCGGKVSFRQCMWTEMGKRCAQNEALGAYQKVTFDQNHFMYLDSCECGKNQIFIESETGKGMRGIKEVCNTCGMVKE